MSHIFEALQRAEAERRGQPVGEVPDSALALMEQEVAPAPPRAARQAGPAMALKALFDGRELAPSLEAASRLVCLTDQGSLAAERFRSLGLRLRNLRETRPLKRVLITSSIPEEGKTFVAANLALNQSRSKVLKTLLLDGDLRRPALAARFGFDRYTTGLSELLRGEKQLAEVVYRIRGTSLHFLPAGAPPENPLELMQSAKLLDLLSELEQTFDWIIIDSPPVVPLADASFWMKLCDGVLLVTREGVSERSSLERCLETVDQASVLGVVVNGSSVGDHQNYYARYTRLALENSGTRSCEP